MLLQRVGGDPRALTARQALELGTLGGARVLGRDDVGTLEKGKAADFIAVNANRLDFAGALHDPVSALVFCTPPRVDLAVINGRVVVENGELETLDLPPVIERPNRAAREMVEKAGAR